MAYTAEPATPAAPPVLVSEDHRARLNAPASKSYTLPGLASTRLLWSVIAPGPDPERLAVYRAEFSLRPLLDQDRNSPMLVVNGADDVHVPQHDTLVFQGRRDTVVNLVPDTVVNLVPDTVVNLVPDTVVNLVPDTVVNLVPDTGHCAVSRLPEAFPTIIGWLDRTLTATAETGR